MAIGTTMAMLGAAAIGGVASIGGGMMQAGAARDAAAAQADSADKSIALQREQYNQSRTDSLPWMEAGRKALAAYQGELGLSGAFNSGFKETPGYQFAVSEGEQGVTNNLSALGMKNSGAALKALTRFRTGLADQTYNNYLDRLSGMSTGGQAQVSQNASLGANYANNAGQTLQDKGAATASGYVGAANAWSGALSNLSNQAGWALGMGSNGFGRGLNFGGR